MRHIHGWVWGGVIFLGSMASYGDALEKTVALPYVHQKPATDADVWALYNHIKACNDVSKIYAPKSTMPKPDANGCIDVVYTCMPPEGV